MVPPEHHVVSLCPAKVQVAVAGLCTGITPDALRVDPDGISVSWLEYFDEPPALLEQAAKELKKSRKPSATGVVAIANVQRLMEVARKLGLTCSVEHTPIDENDAHCSILGCPDELRYKLALARAFVEFVPNKSIPGFYP
jgi:hypothetical protein